MAGRGCPQQVALSPGRAPPPNPAPRTPMPAGGPLPASSWESLQVLTVLASLAKSCPANLTTSPTRKMGQKGAFVGWKWQVFMSAAVKLGSRFPLGGRGWREEGRREAGPRVKVEADPHKVFSSLPEPQGPHVWGGDRETET